MLINFNHLKTFYNALVQKLKGFRGNWDQNDPSADDYIKNRPFYSEGVQETIIVNQLTSEQYNNGNKPACNFVPGQSYVVIWNGVEYPDLICYEDDSYHCIGGAEDIPFLIDDDGGNNLFIGTNDDIYTVSILIRQEVVHKLDKKFIDMPDGITEDSILPILENNLAPVAFTNDYDSLSGKPNAVQYTPQDLTDGQKAIARANIGAGTSDYNDLINVPRVNFWEDDSNNVTSIPGIIRQNSLPEGYPYVTYTAGELISSIATGTLTATKNDRGILSIKTSSMPNFGTSTFTHGAKYLLIIGGSSYIATCDKSAGGYDPCVVRIDGTNWSLFDNYSGTLQLRLSDWAQLNLPEGTHEWGIYNAIPTYQPIAEKYLPNNPKQYLSFKDTETSYKYYVRITNGTLTTMCACTSIYVKDLSDKTFVRGEPLDLTDMVIAVCEDGSERIVNNCIYPPVVPSATTPIVTITYIEDGISFTTDLNLKINISEQDLIDFEYIAQEDGTYTLTDWKGTLHGEISTKCIVPNSDQIII